MNVGELYQILENSPEDYEVNILLPDGNFCGIEKVVGEEAGDKTITVVTVSK